jgi:thioredoxin 1
VSEFVGELKDADFDTLVMEEKLPVMIDFWATWCMPCKALTPAVEQVAQEYAGKLKVYKLNIEESPATASKFGVRSIPTLLFFKDGRVMDQIVGLVPVSKIQASVKKLFT